MHTLTADELNRQPQQLVDDARRGEPTIVTVAGEPVMLTLPLGKGIDSEQVRTELAATLSDREQISLGLAARIGGLSYTEMLDELGKREISVIRLSPANWSASLRPSATPRVVVSDLGPLIAPGRVPLLGRLVEQMQVPRAVLAECVARPELADARPTRQHALELGLAVIGTLGVLVRAKRKGLVPEVHTLIERLRASGQRLSHAAVAEALAAAGELR